MQNFTFVGDIHSASDDLEVLLNDPIINQSKIIFIGDYIDGNDTDEKGRSKLIDPIGVLDIVMKRVIQHGDVALLGNHEDFWLQTSYGDGRNYQVWKSNGGVQTWKKLDIRGTMLPVVANQLNENPLKRYTDFIKNLPLTWENDNILAVHAGINWGYPLEEQARYDLLWIRKGYLTDDENKWHKNELNKIIVTGHTPVQSLQGAIGSFIRIQANEDDTIRYLIDSGSRSRVLDGGILGLTLDENGNEVQVKKVVDTQIHDLSR